MTRDAKAHDPEPASGPSFPDRAPDTQTAPPPEASAAWLGNILPPSHPPATVASDEPHDPFDPTLLRLNQDFGVGIGVRKILTTVPVRKPGKEVFVRTHADRSYWLETCVVELKEDREIYLVDPSLWPALAAETTFGPKLLVTSVTRQGVLFVWPIRLPGPDGKLDDWNRSAMEAAEVARTSWTRVQANMSLGAYDVVAAPGTTAAPEFPDKPLGEILKVAFKDRYITDLDHPVLRRLRGEL